MNIETGQLRNSCEGRCDLVNFCIATEYVHTLIKPDIAPAAVIEAEQVIKVAEESMLNAELHQLYEEWLDRMHVKYADEPESLQKAIDAIKATWIDGQATRFTTDMMRQESLEMARAEEDSFQEESGAVAAALKLRDKTDCPGPATVRVGRFLAKKTVMICGLESTPEFTKIRELRDKRQAE